MSDFASVKAAARGLWPEIWAALGVGDLPALGRHGPCPGCGGHDRFRQLPEEADRGGWICGGGGNPTGGDGFALLVHCGIARTPSDALRLVVEHLGIKLDASPEARQRARERARQAQQAKLEVALLHELAVLSQVLNQRVAGRTLARDRKFRAVRPEWTPMPDEHWEREKIAARRVHNALGSIYEL